IRQTGGFAPGATNTKSKSLVWAISNASCFDLTPNWSPFESINLTSLARIFSLTFMSLLISSHLQIFLLLLSMYFDKSKVYLIFSHKKCVGTICTHTYPNH